MNHYEICVHAFCGDPGRCKHRLTEKGLKSGNHDLSEECEKALRPYNFMYLKAFDIMYTVHYSTLDFKFCYPHFKYFEMTSCYYLVI